MNAISALAAAALALCAAASAAAQSVHERLLTLDSHLDTPALLGIADWSILERHDVRLDGSQIDLPRMIDGGLDGGLFVTYVPQGPRTPEGRAAARDAALLRVAEIRELVAANSVSFEIARTADDAPRIAAAGKRVVYLSMENGYPFGNDLSLLKTFHSLGVRIAGPVHFLNNDLGDSSTDSRAEWHGLSPLGREFVREANRLGIVIDASHASDEVLDQLIQLSAAPILLSHSGARAVFDHPRNVDDDRLRALAASGGVIQVLAYGDYMVRNAPNPERDAALADLRARFGASASRTRADLEARQEQLAAIDRRHPISRASFEDFIAHLLHAIDVAGTDHVGIGIDFDGGGGVVGLEDARDYPKITERLLAAGYSAEDVGKMWSGNLLRVIARAQSLADHGS